MLLQHRHPTLKKSKKQQLRVHFAKAIIAITTKTTTPNKQNQNKTNQKKRVKKQKKSLFIFKTHSYIHLLQQKVLSVMKQQ